jgi:hypothetical protein
MEVFIAERKEAVMSFCPIAYIRSHSVGLVICVALVLSGTLLLHPSKTWAQAGSVSGSRSISSQSVSHKSVSVQSIPKATVYQPTVSKATVGKSGLSRSGGNGEPLTFKSEFEFADSDLSKFLDANKDSGTQVRHTQITEVYGSAQGKTVLPPLLTNTFVLKAQYYRPNPADENNPFQVETREVHMPLPDKDRLYWAPNQTPIILK